MSKKAKITNIINNNLNVHKCLVKDVSELHRGHAEHIEGEETHFEVIIISNDFENKTKLERHRLVNNFLRDEFESSLHSITFKLITINEN